MTPRRRGLACGALAALGFLAISWLLHVRPGHPMAERTDVFFQSDAGGLIQDAVLNRDNRARGTHPLVYPLWTRPLHSLCHALAPTVPPETTAILASRLLVALAAGAGIGALAGALASRGLAADRVVGFAVLATVANGHALAAIPDHFGFSVGAIGICFAVVLANIDERKQLLALMLLVPILFGITITNALLPLGLIGLVLVRRHWHRRRTWHLIPLALAVLGTALAIRTVAAMPSVNTRLKERVSLYLTVRLANDPVAALGYAVRGVGDAVVAPTPDVTRNNIDLVPMLTYERAIGPRPFWPHDGLQTVGVAVWMLMLVWGSSAAWHDDHNRTALLGTLGWAAGNAVFHNVWGDEYFLYSPHYALPLLLLAAMGFRTIPTKLFYAGLSVIALAALHTLRIYSERLNAIVE